MIEITRLSYEEWRTNGEMLFGKDIEKWKFVCPSCKTVQTLLDWRRAGATKRQAGENIGLICIGNKSKKKGCKWKYNLPDDIFVSYHDLEVELPNGNIRPTFHFAKPKGENNEKTR